MTHLHAAMKLIWSQPGVGRIRWEAHGRSGQLRCQAELCDLVLPRSCDQAEVFMTLGMGMLLLSGQARHPICSSKLYTAVPLAHPVTVKSEHFLVTLRCLYLSPNKQ